MIDIKVSDGEGNFGPPVSDMWTLRLTYSVTDFNAVAD